MQDDTPLVIILVIATTGVLFTVLKLVYGRSRREIIFNNLLKQIEQCKTINEWKVASEEVHRFLLSLNDVYEAKKFVWSNDLTKRLRKKYTELSHLN